MTLYRLGDVTPELPEDGSHYIAPGAHVIGRVVLGKNTGIWFGAVLRGDNEAIRIGDNTNIQEHSMLHTDPGFPLTIGNGCTIGHRAICHGCEIGEGSLIGMGAIILNGAKIGKNCLVGAGALVTENRIFEDGSLIIGSPAKAVKSLTPDQIAGLGVSAAAYVANAERFRHHLSET